MILFFLQSISRNGEAREENIPPTVFTPLLAEGLRTLACGEAAVTPAAHGILHATAEEFLE